MSGYASKPHKTGRRSVETSRCDHGLTPKEKRALESILAWERRAALQDAVDDVLAMEDAATERSATR